jgi:hypothetical protein
VNWIPVRWPTPNESSRCEHPFADNVITPSGSWREIDLRDVSGNGPGVSTQIPEVLMSHERARSLLGVSASRSSTSKWMATRGATLRSKWFSTVASIA